MGRGCEGSGKILFALSGGECRTAEWMAWELQYVPTPEPSRHLIPSRETAVQQRGGGGGGSVSEEQGPEAKKGGPSIKREDSSAVWCRPNIN